MKALVNGQPADKIEVSDRGLHYGDGVFETMALRRGKVRHLAVHFERLERSCQALYLPLPDRSTLRDELDRLCEHHADAVIKLVVTRGSGPRGYAPPVDGQCNRVFILESWPSGLAERRAHGIAAMICKTRLGINPDLAGIKHLNRLEQVLAARELQGTPFTEGIMRDVSGQLVEGTRSNLFFVRAGELLTPVLDTCGVAGIMRGRVIDLARDAGVRVAIGGWPLAALADFEEVFVTNSIAGIVPICAIDDRQLAVGPLTRRMQALCDAGGEG